MAAYLTNRARPVLLAADAAALRAEPSAPLRTGQLAALAGLSGGLPQYDEAATAADDGVDYWRPDDVDPGDPGRWVRLPLGGSGAPDFAEPVVHVNEGGAPPAAPDLFGLSVLLTVGADRPGVFYDPSVPEWAFGEDTLGTDATLSAYLPAHALAFKAESYFATAAASGVASGALRIGQGEELRGRAGAGDYRLAASLAGPVLAFGDATAAEVDVDADALLQLAADSGAVALCAPVQVSVYDAPAGSEVLRVDTSSLKVLVKGTVDTLSSSTLTLGGTATDVSAAGNLGATGSVTAGAAGLVSPKWDRADAGALTLGGTNATSVAFSGLALTGALSVASATSLTLTASSGALAADASAAATLGASSATSTSIGHGTITDTITGLVDCVYAGIANTLTNGRQLRNTTAATSGVTVQRAPTDYWEGSAWVSGALQTQGYRLSVLPRTSGNVDLIFESNVGGSFSERLRLTSSSASQFKNAVVASTYGCTSGSDGFYFETDNSGMTRKGGGGLQIRGRDGSDSFDLIADAAMNLQAGGTTTRSSWASTGAQTHTLPVSIVHRTIWGTKCFKDETANFGTTTDAATTTAITTYSAADESVFQVVAKFTAWVNDTDYGGFIRHATFRRDGGTLAIVGTSQSIGVDQASAGFATVTCALDANGTTIRGVVTGVLATTISWSCALEVWGETP